MERCCYIRWCCCLIPCLLWLLPASVSAQNAISGSVQDQLSSSTLPYASIRLFPYYQDDSQNQLTNEGGRFLFSDLSAGYYRLEVSYVGYEDYVQDSILLKNIPDSTYEMPPIALILASGIVDTVMIEALRPAVVQEMGKIVVNVEGSPLAQNQNLMEVLQKAPGVALDMNDQITFRGRSGVLVLMDGKELYMTGEELSEFLRGLPSHTIDQIELIAPPPAKYDASGTAGIINIKTIKSRQAGTNGSLTGGLSYGRFLNPKAGIILNHRTVSGLSVGFNYSYNRRKRPSLNETYRTVQMPQGKLFFDQTTERISDRNSHSAKLAMDWERENHTFGLLGQAYTNTNFVDNPSITSIGISQTDSIIDFSNQSDNFRINGSINLNHEWRIDTTGRLLKTDIDYARFYYRSEDFMISQFQLPDGNFYRPEVEQRSFSPAQIEIWAATMDYSHPLENGIIESGWKSSFAHTDNELLFEILRNGEWLNDQRRSNHFLFDQWIHAAYIDYSGQSDKWQWNLGLRGEYSKSIGNSLTLGEKNERQFMQLFPSGYLQGNFGNHMLGVNYGRRVDRPDYNSLNPFVFFVDNYSFWQGNVHLRPQTSHSGGFFHSYKQWLFTNLTYIYTSDLFQQLPVQDDETGILYNTIHNLGKSHYLGLNVSAYQSPKPWWYISANVGAYYMQVVDQRETNQPTGSATGIQGYIFLYQSFSLPKSMKLEVTASYNTPNRSFWVVGGYGALNLGLSKQFKKGSLALSVNDVFNTTVTNAELQYQNLDIVSYYKPQTRFAAISYTHRFGKNGVKKVRDRESGIEDEKDRTK